MLKKDYRRECSSESSDDENDGEWNMDKTKGEKHQTRIKMLNATKRNEQFDELYEESREDREDRLSLAEKKRALMEEEKARFAEQGIILDKRGMVKPI